MDGKEVKGTLTGEGIVMTQPGGEVNWGMVNYIVIKTRFDTIFVDIMKSMILIEYNYKKNLLINK